MKLKNYDPARATSRDLFQYAAFVFDNDKMGERTVLIPPWQLDGKEPDEVRAHVQRTYEVFRRAEEYAEAQDFSYTDEKALERATRYYTGVMLVITINCISVYTARLDEDTEEARAEQAYLDDLNEKININEHITEAIEKSAEWLCEQWIEDNGPEHARSLVQAVDFHMTKQLAAAAIFEADEQVPPDATDEAWRAAFGASYRAQLESGLGHLSETHGQHEAADILENDLKPVEMSFKQLRMWAGISYVESLAEHGESSQLTLSVKHKLADYMSNLFADRYNLAGPLLNEPENETSTEHRLTSAQMNLMIYTLLGSYENSEGERPFVWSPKAYLERSPTKSEAAILSRRLAVLVDHGLLEKTGREISVTDEGRALIHAYAGENKYDRNLLKVRLVLELNETWKNLEALKVARDIARKRAKRDLVRHDGRGPLHDLINDELKRQDDLVQQIRDNVELTSMSA